MKTASIPKTYIKLKEQYKSYMINKKGKLNSSPNYALNGFFLFLLEKNINLFHLSVKDVNSFKRYLMKKYEKIKTVKNVLSNTRSFYKYLKEIGKVEVDPFHEIKLSNREKKKEQYRAVLNTWQLSFINQKPLINQGTALNAMRRLAIFCSKEKLDLLKLELKEAIAFSTHLKELKDEKGNLFYIKKTCSKLINQARLFYEYLTENEVVNKNPFLQLKLLEEVKKKNETMKDFDKLQIEFLKKAEKVLKGYQSYKFTFRVLNQYCSENEKNYLSFKYKEATEYRTYLLSENTKNYSRSTINGFLCNLTNYYTFLKRKNRIAINPFIDIKKISVKKELPKNLPGEKKLNGALRRLSCFWTKKDLYQKAAMYRAHLVAELMYSTGMSSGEVKRTLIKDIDFNRGIIKVQKNKETNECILNEYVSKLLRIYMDEIREPLLKFYRNEGNDLLFGSVSMLGNQVNKVFDKEVKKLKLNTQLIRYILGYHLIKSGIDLRFIQDILRHKKLESTQKLLKLDKRSLRNIIDRFHPRCKMEE